MTEQKIEKVSKPENIPVHVIMTIVFALAAMITWTAFPEHRWSAYLAFAFFILSLGKLLWAIRKSVSRRTIVYGANSVTTVMLALAILGVLNFIGIKYPQKWDLTKSGINTLSDQTTKLFRGLNQEVKFVFWAKPEDREKVRPLFDNIKGLSPKVSVEHADAVKEITRAKQAGIKAESTLQILMNGREVKVEGPTEEKVTNAVIKLSKSTVPVICTVTEHGERDFDSDTPEGYGLLKSTLERQSYEFKKLNLIAEGKIPTNCSVLAIIGPSKAFFEPEMKLIRDYVAGGGTAFIALDINLKGGTSDASPELTKYLAEWGVESDIALVVDPVSQMLQLEATVPVIPTFNKEISITKEMQGNTVFPLSRPLRISAKIPEGAKVSWLTQTTPNAWGERNLTGLVKGSAKFDPSDIRGPMYTAIAVDGKPTATTPSKKPRLVVFGTSLVAANQWSRFGNNLDLVANAVSWLLEDESLISIRAKEDPAGSIQLSAVQGGLIRLFTVLVIPGIMIVLGIVVWLRRKKL